MILSELFGSGTLRFFDIERAIPGVTQKILIRPLKEFEQDGLILRKAFQVVPPKVEYSLTQSARAPAPAELMRRAAAHQLPAAKPINNPSCEA